MTIGERIKDKRIALGLSQDELAKKCGYKSRSSIQKIESARNLPLTKVSSMALALDCSPSELMGWTDEHISEDLEKKNQLQKLAISYMNGDELKKYAELPQEYKDIVNSTIDSVYKAWKLSKGE